MATIPTYSFDPGLSTIKDRIRSRIGDVSSNPQWFLADQTILAYCSQFVFPDASVNFNEVCAVCCEDIAAQCIQLAESAQQKNLKRSYADRSQKYYDLADRIRSNAQPGPGEPLNSGALAGPTRQGVGPEYDQLVGALPDIHRSPFDFEPY